MYIKNNSLHKIATILANNERVQILPGETSKKIGLEEALEEEKTSEDLEIILQMTEDIPFIDPEMIPAVSAYLTTVEGIYYEAIAPGAASNQVTVSHINPNQSDSPLQVSVFGTDMTVTLGTDSTGNINTTIEDIIKAFDSPYMYVTASSEESYNTAVQEMAVTNLSGGVDVIPGKFSTNPSTVMDALMEIMDTVHTLKNLPESDEGLSVGSFWNDNGTVKIVTQ